MCVCTLIWGDCCSCGDAEVEVVSMRGRCGIAFWRAGLAESVRQRGVDHH